MRKKVITLFGLLSIVLLMSILSVSAASTDSSIDTCTVQFNEAILSNGGVISGTGTTLGAFNLSIVYTAIDGTGNNTNISSISWNLTDLEGGIHSFGGNISSIVFNYSNYGILIDTARFPESTYSLNVTATKTQETSNIGIVACETFLTNIRIDNRDITVPTINGPIDEIIITTFNAVTVFNVTAGNVSGFEQIRSATLTYGQVTQALTAEDTNQTTYSTTLTGIAELAYIWFVTVTDSDGTTTAVSATRTIIFDYPGGGSQITPDQIEEIFGDGGLSTTTIIVIAAIVILLVKTGVFKKK